MKAASERKLPAMTSPPLTDELWASIEGALLLKERISTIGSTFF